MLEIKVYVSFGLRRGKKARKRIARFHSRVRAPISLCRLSKKMLLLNDVIKVLEAEVAEGRGRVAEWVGLSRFLLAGWDMTYGDWPFKGTTT